MEPSLKTFSKQAEQLYERGVAAAKGGQRTMAISLLRQAVRLNPRHEYAWLWLGGLLDKPEDQAFCLQAVLDLNPANERARQGLTLLEQRQQQAPVPAKPRPAPTANPLDNVAPPDPWWLRWRDAQQAWRLTVRLFWLLPTILLVITMILRWQITTQPLPTQITYRNLATVVPQTPRPTAPPETPVPTPPVDPAIVTYYFQQVRALQGRLHAAADSYRQTAAQSRTTVERVAAARNLREAVATERTTLLALVPPRGVETAHGSYLEGLQLEQQALDNLLEFYTKYEPAFANRAALGLQDARDRINVGKQGWDAYAQTFNEQQ